MRAEFVMRVRVCYSVVTAVAIGHPSLLLDPLLLKRGILLLFCITMKKNINLSWSYPLYPLLSSLHLHINPPLPFSRRPLSPSLGCLPEKLVTLVSEHHSPGQIAQPATVGGVSSVHQTWRINSYRYWSNSWKHRTGSSLKEAECSIRWWSNGWTSWRLRAWR